MIQIPYISNFQSSWMFTVVASLIIACASVIIIVSRQTKKTTNNSQSISTNQARTPSLLHEFEQQATRSVYAAESKSYLDTLSGMQQLSRLGNRLPIVGPLVSAFDDVLSALIHFETRKDIAISFANRLDRVALVLHGLIDSSSRNHIKTSEYEVILNDLCTTLVDAHKYCVEYSNATFWTLQDPKSKFDEADATISKLLTEMTVVLNLSNRLTTNSIQDRLEDIDQGPHRQIKNPAMKLFWRRLLNPNSKIEIQMFLEYCQSYLDQDSNSDPVSDGDIDRVIKAMKQTLSRIDENKDGFIDVFEINRATRHIDSSFGFLQTLVEICGPTKKVIPSITRESRDRIVWGTANCLEEGFREVVLRSLQSSDAWTIVSGPPYSGKSFRWMVAAHDIVDDAVVWLDVKNVRSKSDLQLSLASQLSLAVTSISDVFESFQRLFANFNDFHSCVVLDHVVIDDEGIVESLSDFIVLLRDIQRKQSLSVILIVNSKSAVTDAIRESFMGQIQTCVSGSESLITIGTIEVQVLSLNEALKLAILCSATDPAILVSAAKCLPGLICSMCSLPSTVLSSISMSDELSSISSNPSSVGTPHHIDVYTPPMGHTPNRSRLSNRLRRREEHIINSLPLDQKICAACLFAPLKKGFIFTDQLAWQLCSQAMDGDFERWHKAFNGLVTVGWLQVVGDQGFVVGRDSISPAKFIDVPSVRIVESVQWEIYFRYWVAMIVGLIDVIEKNELIGCAYFDQNMEHFGFVFESFVDTGLDLAIKAGNPLYVHSNIITSKSLRGILPEDKILDLTAQVSNTHGSILSWRFPAAFILSLRRSMVFILCDGMESGVLVDDRYWKDNLSLRSVVLQIVADLGWSLIRCSMAEEAEKVLSNVISQIEKAIKDSPENKELFVILDNAWNHMAAVQRLSGRPEEALANHQKCYESRLRVYGPEHPKTLYSLYNTGIALRALGRLEEAIAAYDKCLAIWSSSVSEKRAGIASSYYTKGVVLMDLKRFDEAIHCFQKSFDIRSVLLGDMHVRTADTMCRLADAFVGVGRVEEAKLLYFRARDTYESSLLETHPKIIEVTRKIQEIISSGS